MGFETKTEIQTVTGGQVQVRNIVKRPLFLPDDKFAADSPEHGGICATCGRMTDCPICDVEPGSSDPNANQQCLKNWTLFISGGGGGYGPEPDYDGTRSIRATIEMGSNRDARWLSGIIGWTKTWKSQPMFWPKYGREDAPGPLVAPMVMVGASSVKLIFGKHTETSLYRTGRGAWEHKEQFSGFGVTVVLTRNKIFWGQRAENYICVTGPYNPNIQWPFLKAWSHPCTFPPENMTQWWYQGARNDWPTDFRPCYRSRGTLLRQDLTCMKWGEKQVAVYHSAISADGLAKKIRCQDFAGLEPSIVARSDESWNGPFRYTKQIFNYAAERDEHTGLRPRMDVPLPYDYWQWEGTPPNIVIFPSENEIYKPADSQRSRGSMQGTTTVT